MQLRGGALRLRGGALQLAAGCNCATAARRLCQTSKAPRLLTVTLQALALEALELSLARATLALVYLRIMGLRGLAGSLRRFLSVLLRIEIRQKANFVIVHKIYGILIEMS